MGSIRVLTNEQYRSIMEECRHSGPSEQQKGRSREEKPKQDIVKQEFGLKKPAAAIAEPHSLYTESDPDKNFAHHGF